MNISKQKFGEMNGQNIELFTLENDNDITIKITNYGGIITSILTPDKNGKVDDIALGFDNLDQYLQPHPYFGAIIGRYANRIGKAKFILNGKEYALAKNDGNNHLHGGIKGFDKVIWEYETSHTDNMVELKLSYHAKDGEENYPGNLDTIVKYILNNKNELVIEFEARTDKPTIVNLTNHSYFNLSGEGSGNILDHEVMINAHNITEVDDESIPTGKLKAVKNTTHDFITSRKIGERIKELKIGYDENFIINRNDKNLDFAAKVIDKKSGRTLEVNTTQPGIQLYTGNYLDGTIIGKSGKNYGIHTGFCLETQHFPDSPNNHSFPTTTLNPGEIYKNTCIYKFGK